MQACWFTESEHHFVLGVGAEDTEVNGFQHRVMHTQAPRHSQQMGLLPERKSQSSSLTLNTLPGIERELQGACPGFHFLAKETTILELIRRRIWRCLRVL